MALYDEEGFEIPQDQLNLFVGKPVYRDEEEFPIILGEQFSEADQAFIRQNGFEAYRKAQSGRTEQDVEEARLEQIRDDNPTMSAIAPYTAEAMAQEGEELDFNPSSGLDVASFLPRELTTGAGIFFEELGDALDLRPEADESIAERFMTGMQTTEAPDESELAEGWYGTAQAIGETAGRDPTNIIPAAKLPKFLSKAPAAIKAAATKIDDLLKAKKNAQGEVLAKFSAKLGPEGYANPASGKIAAEASKEAQRVASQFDDQIKAARQAYDELTTTGQRAKQAAKMATSKGAGEASIELGRQAIDNEEGISEADVMLSASIPAGLDVAGKKMSKEAVEKLQQKLKLRPNQQQRRYKPQAEVLLEEGAVPLRGGDEGIERAVASRIDDINVERQDVQSTLASEYQDAVDEVIRPPEMIEETGELNVDWNPELNRVLNPELEVPNASIVQNFDNLTQRRSELQNQFNTLDPSEQGYFAESERIADEIASVDDALSQIDADEIAAIRGPVDRARMSSGEIVDAYAGEAGLDYSGIFDDSRQEVFERVVSGEFTDPQAQKIIDEINLQEDTMNKFRTHSVEVPEGMSESFPEGLDFTFQSGTGPVRPMVKRAGKMFEQGKVNRYQQNQNPTNPKTIAGEIIWNASRPYVNQIEGMGKTGADYATWLPLQEAIGASAPARANRSFTLNRALADVMESNPFILGMYQAGKVPRAFERDAAGGLGQVMMQVPKAMLPDEDEEEK